MTLNCLLQEVTVSRRGCFAAAAGLALALKSLPALAADKMKQVAFELDKAERLKNVGGSMCLKREGRDVLFVRDSERTIRAFDPACTHNKCNVAYTAEEQLLRCPCHRSAFSLDGKVLNGPAGRPLTVFRVKIDGDRVIVSLPQETQ